ncbi:MAG: transforming growth factor-beta-induced protein [Neolewinella sp.]|jgi:transforming growth factor-beta-induced protein
MFKLSYGWTAILLLLVLGFASCEDDDVDPPALVSITETAVADGRFTTLVSALQRTGLDATLAGTGDFTVFAPTDDAFAAAGIDLSAVSDTDLTNLLLYHVLGVSVTAGEIGDGDTFASTAGTYGPGDSALSMLINKTGSAVSINSDATVVVADIAATNGIIHAIDKVLAPQTIVDFATKAAGTSELAGALVAADLVGALSGTDPLTVFAPVNSAFTAIATTVESLTTEQLVEVLTYHVVSGNVRSEALSVTVVPTLNTTNTIDIRQEGGTFYVQNGDNRTDFLLTDIQGTNGVIHLIDAVLIPSDL